MAPRRRKEGRSSSSSSSNSSSREGEGPPFEVTSFDESNRETQEEKGTLP